MLKFNRRLRLNFYTESKTCNSKNAKTTRLSKKFRELI